MNNINIQNAVVMAANTLLTAGIHTLPVDLKVIAQSVGVELITYQEIAARDNVKLPKLIEELRSDEGTTITKDGRSIIAYNNSGHRGRIAFTIAHEIGHVVQGHVDYFPGNTNDYNSITAEQYRKFEEESDTFAGNLLVPPAVLSMLSFQRDRQLSWYFDTSNLCMQYSIRSLQENMEILKETGYADRQLKQFAEYMDQNPLGILENSCAKIETCGLAFPGNYDKCPFCGAMSMKKVRALTEEFDRDVKGMPESTFVYLAELLRKSLKNF